MVKVVNNFVMLYEQKFLFSLLLTLVVEIPIVVLLVKSLYKQKEIRISKIIFVGFVASALTLPYFWFILPAYITDRLLFMLYGEIIIVCIEMVIYNQLLKLKLTRSFAVSLITNSMSILAGLIFF